MNGVTNGIEDTIPLPSAKQVTISSEVTLEPPLTRRGNGPGLILLVPSGLDLNGHDKTLDPPPLQKWAEEGYAVAQITLAEGEGHNIHIHLKQAIDALAELKECDSAENIGLICTSSRLSHVRNLTIRSSVQRTHHTRCFKRHRLYESHHGDHIIWKQQHFKFKAATIAHHRSPVEGSYQRRRFKTLRIP